MTHSQEVWIEEVKWPYSESKKNRKRFSEHIPGASFHRSDKTCGHKTVNGKGVVGRLERKTK